MISGDVREGMARYCASRDAIDENIGNMVASSWGDGDGLVIAIVLSASTGR